jgi:peptidoglycan hydrolase CwlO-like protein
METYLPIIQATLAEWLQFTIDHPLYAAALIIGVWLLTTLFYSIKVAGLNKKNVTSERLRTTAETELNTAKQQLQQAQTELASTTEQLAQTKKLADAEKQRANISEQQLTERNQQIAATIQTLASSFDIGERPLPVTGILKADDLWQQHDKVIKQLIERLRTEQQAKIELEKFYQAEKAKLAQTEGQLFSLQTNLDSQTSLVLALQTQTATLQQQQNDTQRDLSEVLKKHQADLARLLELERQASFVTHAQPPATPIRPTVEPVAIEIKQPASSFIPKPAEVSANLQNLFKKPTVTREENVIAPLPEIIIPPATTETVITFAAHEPVETAPPVVDVAPTIEIEAVEATPEKTSALKGLYQKLATSKQEPAESAIVIAPVAEKPEKPRSSAALKGLYQKFTTKAEQPKAVSSAAKPETAEKTDGQLKKGLFRKFTSKKTEPEPVDDSSSIEDVADQLTEKLEKLKGVYGKFFSKDKE